MNTRSAGKARHNQKWIYRRLIKLGHCHEKDCSPDVDGVCHGLACAAMEAILLSDFSEFDRLIKFSNTQPSHLFSSQTISFDALIKINELYKNIVTLQSEQPTNLGISLDVQIEGISLVKKVCGVYTQQNLRYYFETFSDVIRQTDSLHNKPITLYLENRVHAICISYNVKQNMWYLIDADNLPIKRYLKVRDLATNVVKSLFSSKDKAIVTTSIYCRKADKQSFKRMAASWSAKKKWRELHTFSEEQIATTDSFGANLLLVLMLHDQTTIAKALLENGANPNPTDSRRYTPLHLAIKRDQVEMVNLLCSKGANPNVVKRKEKTLLFYAIQRGNLAIVKTLLQHNASVVTKCCVNKNDLSRRLIRHKISTDFLINYPNELTLSPYEYATALLRNDIADLIREHSDQNIALFSFFNFFSKPKRPRDEEVLEERAVKRQRIELTQ